MTDETFVLHLAWRYGKAPSEVGAWSQTDLELMKLYAAIFIPHFSERLEDIRGSEKKNIETFRL